MKFFSYLTLFFGAATATPLVHSPLGPRAVDVKILSVSAVGSGCPSGTAYATIDSSGTIFDVSFAGFIAQVGPGSSGADARKNCRISISVKYPDGYSWTIMNSRFSGYAGLASGQVATCKATYTYSGWPGSNSAETNIQGPADTNYELRKDIDIITWSPCGFNSGIININAEVRISPITTPSKGIMTVDAFDGRFHVISQINWTPCR